MVTGSNIHRIVHRNKKVSVSLFMFIITVIVYSTFSTDAFSYANIFYYGTEKFARQS